MEKEFNKQVLLDNTAFYLKERNLKIGELEAEVGVSPGYISRINKDSNAKPGVDFVYNVAQVLGVSIDTLLNVSMTEITPTERYLISFLEKLKADTAADKLDWARDSKDFLDRLEPDYDGDVEHPLFHYRTFQEEGESGYPEEVSRVVFISHSFDVHTAIHGDCFAQRLKNGTYVYLMNVSKSVYRVGDKDAFALEVWMWSQENKLQFLCSDKYNAPLADAIHDLYGTIIDFAKHPKVKNNLKYVIDAFMRDDLSDDPPPSLDDDLPF